MKKVLLISAVFLFIDQLVKGLLTISLDYGQTVEIIKNFFSITLIQNTGAAFSILSQNTILLIVLTIIVLNAIYFIVIKDQKLDKFENITYGILIGGILGNFVDRIFNGYVIDYMHFHFLGYNFPIFNFADMCIVISVILIIIQMFRRKNGVQSN